MEHRLVCTDSSILVDALAGLDVSLTNELHAWAQDEVPLVAPDLIHYEVTHVLTKYVRNKRLAASHAEATFEALLSLNITLIDDDELHRSALESAMSNPGLSGYDAQFLSVSERLRAELWTADKGLATISQRLGVATRLWVSDPA
jgi:predicted nucleic acid-binding protein